MNRQEKRHFWQAHIDSWQQSGLSQTEYTRQHKLSVKSFAYYKTRYSEITESAQDQPVKMNPLLIDEPAGLPDHSGITLTTQQGYKLDVPPGFHQDTLRQLLVVLA